MGKTLKKYDKYKGTDVTWLGAIPEHWDIKKIKHLFDERVEKGFPYETLLSATQSRGVIPQTLYQNRTVIASKDLHLLKLVEIGDFVISLRSFQGGIEYAYYRGIISPAYTVMKLKRCIVSGYFKYFSKSEDFIKLLQTCVTGIREGQNIDYKLLKKNFIPIPSPSEQDQIVRYLDSKVAMINKFLKAKKREIELLKEQKQAEINQTVTRGLNPNAAMKDSGIDWIGEVPEHWRIVRLKNIFRSNIESLSNNTNPELEISYLDISSVGFGFIKQSPELYLFKDTPSRARRIIHEGDIIISTVRTYLKSLCYISEELSRNIVSTGFAVLSPMNEHNPLYLNYALSVNYFIENVIKNSVGISYPAINDEKLMSQRVTITTDISEQQQIVTHITQLEARINKAITAIETEINLIQEYKKSLISDVVTGKIDVRGIEIEAVTFKEDQLPEDIEIETEKFNEKDD